jgi:hypothetical protein
MRTFPGVIGMNDCFSFASVLKIFSAMSAVAQSYDAPAILQAKWPNWP